MRKKSNVVIPATCLSATTALSVVAGQGFSTIPLPAFLAIVLLLTAPLLTLAGRSLAWIGFESGASLPLTIYLTVNMLTLLNLTQDASVSLEGGNSLMSWARLALRIGINTGIAVSFIVSKTHIPGPARRWQNAIMFFAVASVISTPMSNQLLYSFGRWLDMFVFLIASLLVMSHIRLTAHTIIMSTFMCLFLITASLWCWRLIDPEPLTRVIHVGTTTGTEVLSLSRFGGTVVPPGVMGFVGAALLLLSLYALRATTMRFRTLAIVAGALGILTAEQSEARTALVALSVAVVWTIASQLGGKDGKYSVFAFVWLGSTGFLIWLLAGANTSVLSRHSGDTSVTNLTGRTDLWHDVLTTFAENPTWWPFGAGFNTLSSTFRMGALITESAHNGYLQILMGTGIFGLTAYLLILGKTLTSSLGASDPLIRSTLISVLLLLIVHNFAEIGAFVMMSPATLIAASVAVAAIRADRQPIQSRTAVRRPLLRYSTSEFAEAR